MMKQARDRTFRLVYLFQNKTSICSMSFNAQLLGLCPECLVLVLVGINKFHSNIHIDIWAEIHFYVSV